MHNEKEKDCKFFVVQGSNQAVLGMPDIDNLGIPTINCETLGSKWHQTRTETARETANMKEQLKQNRKSECCKNKRQDAEVQSQHNADNMASQVLLLIKQSQVEIAMKTTSLWR